MRDQIYHIYFLTHRNLYFFRAFDRSRSLEKLSQDLETWQHFSAHSFPFEQNLHCTILFDYCVFVKPFCFVNELNTGYFKFVLANGSTRLHFGWSE